MCKILLEKYTINIIHWENIIYYAAYTNNIKIIKLLFEHSDNILNYFHNNGHQVTIFCVKKDKNIDFQNQRLKPLSHPS